MLALCGATLSVILARLHARAHAGFSSFCAISDVVNCDRVATSRFSVFLGLPVAVWGAFGYGVAAVLAARALARARRGGAASTGLLFAVAAVAVAASVALAIVSKAAIGAWCLLCVASWVTAVALLAAAWRACPAGPAAAVAADLAAMRAQPARSAGLALVLLAAVVGTRAAYPRYWAARPARPGTVAPPAGARTPAPAPASATLAADRVVVEFSDYECPFCARAHEQLALLRAARPDLEIVRRHFPLDAACNPAVKRSIHPSACGLARAAICADAQGRFPQMDDALFKNQQAGEPVSRLAAGIGLDVPAFQACLTSPATEARLARDVEDGMRAGVRATPSYVVGGRVYAGELPPQIWSAPSGSEPTRRAAER